MSEPIRRPGLDLAARLRQETRGAHVALESSLPIAQADPITLDIYREHLTFLAGFHRVVEPRLQSVPDLAGWLPDLPRRWKGARLRADLDTPLRDPWPTTTPTPAPSRPTQALGVLYVLEGATLGARRLIPRLRDDGVVPGPVGTSYVDGYGAATQAMWSRFCAGLDRVPHAETDEVVAWALITFASLRAWWDERRRLPCP